MQAASPSRLGWELLSGPRGSRLLSARLWVRAWGTSAGRYLSLCLALDARVRVLRSVFEARSVDWRRTAYLCRNRRGAPASHRLQRGTGSVCENEGTWRACSLFAPDTPCPRRRTRRWCQRKRIRRGEAGCPGAKREGLELRLARERPRSRVDRTNGGRRTALVRPK